MTTHNGIKIGDKIQCENDKDELFVGYVRKIVDENILIFEDEDTRIHHTALASWCEVVCDCQDCQDTGEIVFDEFDEDSHNYMNGTGVRKCDCRNEQEDV